MLFLGYLVSAVLGAIFGSYATLFAYRIPRQESCFGRYFGPKSRCPHCNTIIRTRELIPIINWLFTRGKCISCNAKIPKTFLFIELATTVLFVICYHKFSFSESFIIFSLLSVSLVIAIAIDYHNKFIPNEILITILILGLIERVLMDKGIVPAILSAALGIVLSALFYKIFYQNGAGFLKNQKQAFSYAKFIVIASICFSPNLFLLYFLAVLSIFTVMIILGKSLKRDNFSLGFSLVMPFIWLITCTSFANIF